LFLKVHHVIRFITNLDFFKTCLCIMSFIWYNYFCFNIFNRKECHNFIYVSISTYYKKFFLVISPLSNFNYIIVALFCYTMFLFPIVFVQFMFV
jgi:hypothetical protein